MLSTDKRRQVQRLLALGRSQVEVARITGASVRTVKRIAKEPAILLLDDALERRRRGIGRPSKVERYRALVRHLLLDEPPMRSGEILRRTQQAGYSGGKSAMYSLIASIRRSQTRPLIPETTSRVSVSGAAASWGNESP